MFSSMTESPGQWWPLRLGVCRAIRRGSFGPISATSGHSSGQRRIDFGLRGIGHPVRPSGFEDETCGNRNMEILLTTTFE
jgi:hypothetical protein